MFQPHLYSRTRDFGPEFARSLSRFDEVWLLDIYPARELPIEGIDSRWLLGLMENPRSRWVAKDRLVEETVLAAREKLSIDEDGLDPARTAYMGDDIPDLPLPDGIEVRPVRPEQMREIVAAHHECFRGEWDFSEIEEREFAHIIDDPCRDETLWQVAWDGDTIVGGAWLDDDGGGNAGAAYVFDRQGGSWLEQGKLTPADPAGVEERRQTVPGGGAGGFRLSRAPPVDVLGERDEFGPREARVAGRAPRSSCARTPSAPRCVTWSDIEIGAPSTS